MRFIRSALARIAGAFSGQSADDEMREEFEAHVEMETAENIRRGMGPDEARRQALVAAGGLTQAAEAVRDQRGLPWLESIGADLKYAVRSLRHSPAFTAIVVITLALGIGANTAIFSVVRGVLLKPLPHRDGHRLMYVRHSMDGPGGANLTFSVPEVRDFRTGTTAFSGIAEFSEWSMIYQGGDGAVRMPAGLVTGNYFEVMGLSPILGRVTGPADDGPGVPPVTVLTHEGWMKHFGGDSSIVGKQLRMDGNSVTVIGVLQPAPFFPARVEALFNMVNSQHHLSAFMVEGRSHRMTEMVARLAPDATLSQARSEVAAVTARMQREYKDAYQAAANHQVAVIPFRDVMGERARLTLMLLMGAAAFVMIISAANVANLTLMRGVRREHELVVRAALGAGVARLRRLLLVENLLLALLGAAVGVLIAFGGVRLLTTFAERYSPRASEIRLDGVVLGFTVALAGAVALLLSFLATIPREGAFASWILAGAHRLSAGLTRSRLQKSLVVLQIAVSVMLLAGAGLLTRTMIRLADVQTGLRTEEILTMQVNLLTPTQILSNPMADGGAKDSYQRIKNEIAAIAGVLDVGVGGTMPLRSSGVRFDLKVDGKTLEVGQAIPRAELRTADPQYFRASGIPIVKGRAFSITDQRGSERVAVVNETLANRLFPGEDPIGKRIAFTGEVLKFAPISGDWRTVVGVSAATQDGGLDAKPALVVYSPFAQELALGGGFVIRADSNVAALASAASRIVRRHAPTVPIENLGTIAQYKDRSVSPRRLNAAMLSSFGGLAVLIAAVGIAGVLAFSVSARTNEIGIRMSLGADSGRVLRMILGEGGTLLLVGLMLGLVGAWFTMSLMQGLLFGVEPKDPVTLLVVTGLMAVVGLLACWIPARRAARIDPAIAMRA